MPGIEEIVRKDQLIREFGLELIGRLGTDKERRRKDINHIQTKLRAVARLCQEMRQISGTKLFMNDYVHPQHFRLVLRATKQLALKSPSLGVTLGHYVKHLVMLKKSQGIEQGNQQIRRDAEDFKDLMDARWMSQVTTVTRRRQNLAKLNVRVELPTTKDLVAASEFFKQRINTETNPHLLSKFCLAQLIMFNKRRPMEVAEITKEDFKMVYQCHQDNAEVLNSLDVTEKALVKR